MVRTLFRILEMKLADDELGLAGYRGFQIEVKNLQTGLHYQSVFAWTLVRHGHARHDHGRNTFRFRSHRGADVYQCIGYRFAGRFFEQADSYVAVPRADPDDLELILGGLGAHRLC